MTLLRTQPFRCPQGGWIYFSSGAGRLLASGHGEGSVSLLTRDTEKPGGGAPRATPVLCGDGQPDCLTTPTASHSIYKGSGACGEEGLVHEA